MRAAQPTVRLDVPVVIDVAPVAVEVAMARRAVGEALRRQAVPSHIVEELQLVASELVTNAVVHPPPSEHPVRVRVGTWDQVLLEVANHGPAGDLPPVEDWTQPGPAASAGRGLGIVRRLCDDVTVHGDADWTVVRCWRTVPEGMLL